MCQIESREMDNREKKGKNCHFFAQAQIIKAGLNKFGKKCKEGVHNEVNQLSDRTVWKPFHLNVLTKDDKKKIDRKYDFSIRKEIRDNKCRMCTSGSTQRICVPKEKASIRTVTTESMLMTSIVDTKQERDAVPMGIPSAFSQTKVPQGDERFVIKIRGALVDMILETDPDKCKDFVIDEGQNKILHGLVLKAPRGMLMARILCCKNK